MFATIENLKKEPITEAEVARIRAKAAKYFDDILSNPQKFGVAISESVALGDWRLFFLQRDRYRSVTAADVQRVALDYLKRSNVTVGEFIPDAKPDRAPVPPTVDVAAMVKDYKGDADAVAGEAFDTSIANLDARTQRFTLPNGMKVALLPKKTRGEAVNFVVSLHFADEKSAFGKQADGQFTGVDADARHDEEEPPGNRGHVRQAARQGQRQPATKSARRRPGRRSARSFPTRCGWSRKCCASRRSRRRNWRR